MRRSAPATVQATLLAALFLVSACSPSRRASAPAPTPVAEPSGLELLGESPEVPEAVHTVRRDILGGVEYDLPVEANSWVEAELDFLVEQRREVVRRWIERGDFYEPFIKEVLRAHGVPTDLYHLAMIESGFVPTAKSRVGAMGLWQFMPATGRQMGLRVDAEVDERMDPVRSTRAAARHLRSLRKSLGDWALAAAAYNAGPTRITRGLSAYQVRDFWSLAEKGNLAAETKHYVPRLYAMTVITRGRERFGFAPTAGAARFAYDSIQVEYATPLEELVTMGEATLEQLTRLNPHLVQRITPAGGYWVWVPKGQGPALQRAYLASDFRKEQGYGSYTVRKGDTLGRLAELSGVPAARIRELNPKTDFDKLAVGRKLRMPYRAAEALSARPVEKEKVAASPAPAEKPVNKAESASSSVHEVKPGESLWQIAERHGVSVAALQKANNLSGSTIRAGAKLQIPDAARGPSAPERAKPEPAEHVVQSGDTLWGIAQKYGTSVSALQDVNKLGERPIRPGQKLTVPAEAEAP